MKAHHNFTAHTLASAVALASLAISFATSAQESRGGYNLQLEEVVVTAQKREENYLSVPLAVNNFSAEDITITGATGIDDIDTFMPGVEIGSEFTGSSTQMDVEIRGVSSPGISSGQDPSVAVFYDGAYLPRAATSVPFTDIERIEVLKGPQGTLFGRNATAGVVNIIANKPSQEFEGFLKTRLGNQDLTRVEGMVNVPVSDSLALRGNVFFNQRDGFTNSATTGGDYRDEKFTAARGVALWTPSDRTEIQLAIDYEDRDELPRVAIGVNPEYSFGASDDPFRSTDQHDVVGSDGIYDNGDSDEEETREMYGIALKVEHELNDNWSMFGILSYRDWETTNLQEEDGTADPRRYLDTNNIEESDIFYSELRFNFVDERFNLIVGANYSKEDIFQRTDVGLLTDSYMQFVSGLLLPEIGIPADVNTHAWDIFADNPDDFWLGVSELAGLAVLPPSFAGRYFTETMDNTGDFVNWGIFADGSYSLTETLTLTAGLRYSYDEKEYSWQTFDNSFPDWPFAPARVAFDPAQTGTPQSEWFNRFEDEDDWDRITGRLVLDWQFTDNALMYWSYSTGYKSGGYDGQSFAAVVAGSFDPEDAQNFEWGIKGDFFDNRFRAEFSAFYLELDDRQDQRDTKDSPDDPTAAPSVVSSDEELYGAEIILTWSITDTLRVSGLTTYRKGERERESFFDAQGEPAGGEPEDIDAESDYTLRLDWTPEIPVGYMLVHVNYVFDDVPGPSEDDVIFATGPYYFEDQKLLNARIAWSADDDSLEVAVWGNNILDNKYATNPGGLAADNLGAFHTNIADRFTYGVDLRYSF